MGVSRSKVESQGVPGSGARSRADVPNRNRPQICDTHQRYLPVGHPTCVLCDIEGAYLSSE